MKKLLLFTTFVLMSMASIAFAQETMTVEIGNGTVYNEVLPIHNWWQRSYTGNETLYLKEELGMQPGDQITSLSYHCISNSAYGGNYNVRIINTTLNRMIEDPIENTSDDTRLLQVPYESTIYGRVHLDPYSADCWITFELDTPFEYTGENIIIDIRNSEPCTRKGWVYFASTDCDQCMSIAWRNAADEAVTGFVEAYDPYGDYDSGFYGANPDEGNRANIRITYIPNEHKPKIKDFGNNDLIGEGGPITNWWMDTYQGTENLYLKDELGLEKGDTISVLAYHCVLNHAYSGNFNVRIINTELDELHQGVEDRRDLSLAKVNYEDTVYGNVHLDSYSAGNWIYFKLSKPFIYEGNNIIIDIRNTEPGQKAFYCCFPYTKTDKFRYLAWWRAEGENITGFLNYSDAGFAGASPSADYDILADIRIFANGFLGDVNDDGKINIADVTALIDHLLGSDADTFNKRNADVDVNGNVNIADVTTLIDFLLSNGN